MSLAVLVSGTGSILDAMVEAGLPVDLVVSDRPCTAISRAAGHDVDSRRGDDNDDGCSTPSPRRSAASRGNPIESQCP